MEEKKSEHELLVAMCVYVKDREGEQEEVGAQLAGRDAGNA